MMRIDINLRELDFTRSEPIGSTGYDNKSLENLEDMIDMMDNAIEVLCHISEMSDRAEYSMNRSGKLAQRTIKNFIEYMNGYVDVSTETEREVK